MGDLTAINIPRMDNPDIQIRGSGDWLPVAAIDQRIYAPVDTTTAWLVEFDGVTRFVVSPAGDARGPWSVVVPGAFDISDFIVQVTRNAEMP